MPARSVSVLDGSTFVVSGELGDVEPAPDRLHGFFHRDTRYLSRWRLTLEGAELGALSVADVDHFAAQFFLAPKTGRVQVNPYLSVILRRIVRGTWVEELLVVNHRAAPAEIALRIDADSDFADLFEVKEGAVRARDVRREASDGSLVLSYRASELRITAPAGWAVDERGFSVRLRLDPHEQRRMSFHLAPDRPASEPAGEFDATRAEMRRALDDWLADGAALEPLYRRSLRDLAALRLDDGVPAAGLPWFMALFGRDSLIASYQALPFKPGMARATLVALAATQADRSDDFRDSEPGKILHELRQGELTETGERPHSPYYGAADATPLFLVLLDEYARLTGDAGLARRLEPNARAALDWIDRYGDLDGDGYVEYLSRNTRTGLANQCWKDSPNAILFADGTLAEPPIATCEIQGYAYDAKRRCARLAAKVWEDTALAERLEREASELRRRFHEDFWVPEGGYYALALDRDKRQVDSLTSNIGHLLWSGIVDPGPAELLARHLVGRRLFSGWGVRTMAAGDAGYNPIEYHNGSVWPHDNSLIAHGLARYGRRAEAEAIVTAQIEAAGHYDGSLPEVFAGYDRALTQFPVEYPTASRPQAWAAGAPLLFLTTLSA